MRGIETPFFIPFRDRIYYLRILMGWLFEQGYKNDKIYIVDNQSSYPEAVEQLKEWESEGVQVLWMEENTGAWGLWKSNIVQQQIGTNARYFVNDPDVVPSDSCRSDILDYHHELLDRYQSLAKVGLSLQINNIPDSFSHKQHVLNHERRYWREDYQNREPQPVRELWSAPIATTFALYRSVAHTPQGDPRPGMGCARTKEPNVGAHLPWYIDTDDLRPDEKFYFDNCPWRRVPKQPGSSWKPGAPPPP